MMRVKSIKKTSLGPLLVLVLFTACAHSTHAVAKVIDGDTVILEGGRKVRLIGVDAPEIHVGRKLRRDGRVSGKSTAEIKRYGLAAKRFVENMLHGEKVLIEYDHTTKDRYGRTLTYHSLMRR